MWVEKCESTKNKSAPWMIIDLENMFDKTLKTEKTNFRDSVSSIQRLVPLDLIKIDVNEFKSKTVLFLVRATHQKYMSQCNVSVDMFCIHIICNSE